MRSNPHVYVLQYPANFSIFILLSVIEHKPTSMSLYCVPLLAKECVFQSLSIKSQCQYKEHMFSPERERESVFCWLFPSGSTMKNNTRSDEFSPWAHRRSHFSLLCLCRRPSVLLRFEKLLYLTEKHCYGFKWIFFWAKSVN